MREINKTKDRSSFGNTSDEAEVVAVVVGRFSSPSSGPSSEIEVIRFLFLNKPAALDIDSALCQSSSTEVYDAEEDDDEDGEKDDIFDKPVVMPMPDVLAPLSLIPKVTFLTEAAAADFLCIGGDIVCTVSGFDSGVIRAEEMFTFRIRMCSSIRCNVSFCTFGLTKSLKVQYTVCTTAVRKYKMYQQKHIAYNITTYGTLK